MRVDRRARRREALLLDHERRHEAALVAHDAGAQVPVDDEAADARDLLALEDDGDVALREDEEPVCCIIFTPSPRREDAAYMYRSCPHASDGLLRTLKPK